MKYVSLFENREHLDRHFAGSKVPGSKFLPLQEETRDKLFNLVDDMLQRRFNDMVNNGKTPGRVVLEVNFGRPVGTDALILIDEGQPREHIMRDLGTAHETFVSVIPVEDQNKIPKTNIVTVMAGPYPINQQHPEATWGIFTLFPGREAPAFPSTPNLNASQRSLSARFWETHGFLATPEEINYARQTAAQALLPSPPKATAPKR